MIGKLKVESCVHEGGGRGKGEELGFDGLTEAQGSAMPDCVGLGLM